MPDSSHPLHPPFLETLNLLSDHEFANWTFHVSGIIHGTLCIWLLSFSIMFLSEYWSSMSQDPSNVFPCLGRDSRPEPEGPDVPCWSVSLTKGALFKYG